MDCYIKFIIHIYITEALTLYVKEHDLLAIAVMILCTYDVFSSIFQLDPIDDKDIIVAMIPLHKLDGLPQLLIVVRPRQSRCCDRNYATSELHALPFVSKRTLWFNDESGRCLSAI